eukprot:773756-Prorocentrum_lima.AAC.1
MPTSVEHGHSRLRSHWCNAAVALKFVNKHRNEPVAQPQAVARQQQLICKLACPNMQSLGKH